MTIVLTWLWQGLALTALTVLVLRAMPWLNAATRHVAWWAALAAVLGIPLVLVAAALRDATPGLLLPVTQDGIQPALVLPAAPDWMGVFCACAWVLTVLLSVMRVAHGGRIVRRLRRRSTPFDSTREARLPLWSSAGSHAPHRAQLRVSDDLAGACALGFGRPVILVGRQLADALDDGALDQIVMHEQAHLERHDDLLQLVEAIVRAVAGWHPAVWWLSRRIDLDREAACDDHVVARTGAARQYARALLDAAVTASRGPTAPAIVPGISSRASALRVRVARLLDPRRARGGRPTPIAAVAFVLPVVASLASPRLAPLVAFVDAVEHALPFPGGSKPPAVALTLGRPTITDGAPPVAPPIGNAPRPSGALRSQPRFDAQLAVPAEPPVSSTVSEGGTVAVPVVPAPLESRAHIGGIDPSLIAAAPAGPMSGSSTLPARRDQSPWQVVAASSTTAAKGTASAVSSAAARRGVAIGRAFSRARHAVTRSF